MLLFGGARICAADGASGIATVVVVVVVVVTVVVAAVVDVTVDVVVVVVVVVVLLLLLGGGGGGGPFANCWGGGMVHRRCCICEWRHCSNRHAGALIIAKTTNHRTTHRMTWLCFATT